MLGEGPVDSINNSTGSVERKLVLNLVKQTLSFA